MLAQLELQTHEVLVKHWRSLAKKEARAAKEAGDAHVPVVDRPEAAFIPSLLDEFLEVRQRLAGVWHGHCMHVLCLLYGRRAGMGQAAAARLLTRAGGSTRWQGQAPDRHGCGRPCRC